MLHWRIEPCGDAPRAPMQPCKRQGRPPWGGPPAWPLLPEQTPSEKSQGVRGTESPDSCNNTLKKTENYVSVFSGELQANSFGFSASNRLLSCSVEEVIVVKASQAFSHCVRSNRNSPNCEFEQSR